MAGGLDAMLDLDAVRTHLQMQLAGVRKLELIADAGVALEARTNVYPAVYIAPGQERAQDLGGVTLAQRVKASFGLVLMVRHAGDVQGAGALGGGALADLRGQCLRALQGWVLNPATGEPVAHRDGRLVKMGQGGLVIWVDSYDVTIYRGV